MVRSKNCNLLHLRSDTFLAQKIAATVAPGSHKGEIGASSILHLQCNSGQYSLWLRDAAAGRRKFDRVLLRTER